MWKVLNDTDSAINVNVDDSLPLSTSIDLEFAATGLYNLAVLLYDGSHVQQYRVNVASTAFEPAGKRMQAEDRQGFDMAAEAAWIAQQG